MVGHDFGDLPPQGREGVAGAAVVAECDRWCAGGSGPAEGTAMAEPPHRAPGEPTRLSEGDAGGSGTAQGTALSETTAVDQPLLQAYRPARGRRAVRSCASVMPVSLCTGEAFRPRE